MIKSNNEIYRKLSDNELSYMKFEELVNPFFQIVFECDINSIDIKKINKALDNLFKSSEVLNLFIDKNYFYLSKRNIEVNIINELVDFDGYNFSNINLFTSKLNDDLMDIYFFHSKNKEYLLFKFNHSYVDAHGARIILCELLRLMDEKNLNNCLKFESDDSYAEKLGEIKEKRKLKYENKLIDKTLKSSNKNFYIKRMIINKSINGITAKIIFVLNKFYLNDNLTYIIPTDIRKISDKNTYISNLTLPLYLKTNKNEEWNEIYYNIYNQIKDKKNLNKKNIKYGMLMRLNNCVYKLFVKISMLIQSLTGKYLTCGNITNIGSITINEFNSIPIRNIFTIPFYQPLIPFSLCITEYKGCTELVLYSKSNIIGEDKAIKMLEKIKDYLENN